MTLRSRTASGPLAAALAALAAALVTWAPSARAQDAERYDHAALEAQRPAELRSAPEPDDPFLAEGQRIYRRSCAPCHGDTGAGDGLVADVMRPRPRDFTAANFAFRTTRSGELPTDADLFRVVSRGVPGTGMPAWGEGIFTLSEQERWQVVYFVKTLSGIFWDEYTNPYRSVGEGEPEPILEIGDAPERTDELVERGRELYLDQTAGGCVRCHGDDGRGDGEAAAEMYDDLGQPARPYDLTNPWRNKNGTAVEDIYRTLSTGISGTPMADFMDGIPEDRDRWALAYYARSLLEERDVSSGALHARRVDGELPDDPDDRAWDSCEPYGVAMMGQYALAPRWQNPSVDYVRLCALHNEHEIAIRVEWDDPFHDAQGSPGEPAPEEPPPDPPH
ncbi:MAG: c-type cytochrome, partial [Deltaproteobacteria bacterium]|nr:c-type cytochrome [Deltaproteobacteria bacterium]